MALLDSEIERIRFELGFNDLLVGAEPYIGVAAIFDQVIKPYLRPSTTTTSSTAVTAVAAGSPASPVSLTLVSVTGFAMFATVIIDVADRQERVPVQAVSGSTIVVPLSKTHSGTYPIMVEGGESMVRNLLDRCREAADAIQLASASAGIKQVDQGDVIFFGGKDGTSQLDALKDQQKYWRTELCTLLFGVGNIRDLRRRGGGSSRFEVY